MTVAFDVDDTLIIPAIATGLAVDTPNYETIAVYRWFQSQGHRMIVWSGGGKDYAEQWGEKLGLRADEYATKTEARSNEVDIAFDDGDIRLAIVNVKVRRLNNKIVRYPDRIMRRPE